MTKKKVSPPPPVDPVAAQRAYITSKLQTAVAAIQNDPRYAWGPAVICFDAFEEVPDNPICSAASALWERVQEYIEGNAAEADLKPLYQDYVRLHLRHDQMEIRPPRQN